MPYCLPSSTSSSPVSPTLEVINHNANNHARNHRRSRSTPISFSLEKTGSAFTPLTDSSSRRTSLVQVIHDRADTPSPVRRARAQFSIKTSDEDDSSSSEEEQVDSVEEEQEVTKLVRGLSLNIEPHYKPFSPPTSPIPFPRLPGSNPPSPSLPRLPTIPKVLSNPIILSNGKPLKSSLKSASSPHLPGEIKSIHLRAASAPSTPITQPKNVHFKDEKDGSLETIRVFNKAGRPANINYSSGNEDTETDGETDGNNSFLFPSEQTPVYRLADAPNTSIIPAPEPPASANVYLESITVPHSRPPLLRGSILVRNITFAKVVAVRFTFDDWQTTSEIIGQYVTSLPCLPPPFCSNDSGTSSPTWEWATSAIQNACWDRFSFTIKLEDMERKLLEKTMFIAVRYQAQGHNGGEWWDNNGGRNYKVAFSAHMTKPIERPRAIPAYKPKVNEMFNPGSASPSFPPSKPNSGYPFLTRPGMATRSHSNPTVPTFLTLGQMNRPITRNKLRLSNYIAPSSSQDDDEMEDAKLSAGSGYGRPAIMAADFSAMSPSFIIGGMPATTTEPVSNLATKDDKNGVVGSPPSSFAKVSPTAFLDRRVTTSSDKVDDSYSQLVKNFCFHQSAPSAGTTTSTVPLKEPWHDSYGGRHTMLMSL